MDIQPRPPVEKGNQQGVRTMKTVRVILSEDAEEVYKFLNSEAPHSKIEKSILNTLKEPRQ